MKNNPFGYEDVRMQASPSLHEAIFRAVNTPISEDVIYPAKQVTAFICPVCGHPEEFVTFAALHLMLNHNWHTTHLETLKAQLASWGIPMADNIYGYLKLRNDQLQISNSVTK